MKSKIIEIGPGIYQVLKKSNRYYIPGSATGGKNYI